MSKQFKWLSILVAVLALALLVVLPTSAAPSNATAGTITLDKAWATAVGTTITITVNDPDLNVAVPQTNEATDFNGANYAIPVGLPNLATWQQRVQVFPILDKNSDGTVNFLDVTTSIAGATVWSVDPSGGLVTFQNNSGAAGAGQTFTVTYNAANVNNTGATVKVYSTTDPTGCPITLTETGPDTGVFTKTFKTAAATNCAATPIELIAGNGATITAAYTDASPSQTVTAAASVETNAPTLSNLLPATGTATATTTQTLFVDVVDSQSGVVAGSIVFKIGKDDGVPGGTANDGILDPAEVDAVLLGGVVTTAIPGGYRAQQTTQPLTEGNYVWSVEANDNAGNTVVLDIDANTAGNQGQKLQIDTTPPTFNNTGPGGANLGKTGEYWDVATKAIKTNKTTSLSVVFSEALDGATVQKEDFTVNTATPLDAYWTSDKPEYVFLTVVALGPSDKPTVGLPGQIRDKAGNLMVPNVTTVVQDGIAPTITAALDKTLTKTTVVLTIVSNEPLAATPTVTKDEAPAGSAVSPAPVPAGANQWTWTYTPGVDGSYVLKVTGTDTSANPGSAGVSRCTTLALGVCTANPDFATKKIMFERDTVVDDPAVSVGGIGLGANPSVYTANPYIVVDFTVEGAEYGINAANAVVLLRGADGIPGTGDDNVLVTGTDTRKMASISKATLDGNPITMTADSASVKFIGSVSGLTLGEHTLLLNFADEAGNVRATDLSLKFTVKARPAYNIPLVAGMNLISFPAMPAQTALKDAFAGTAVDLVVTYDPSALVGPWLIAQKDASGNWSGTLTAVDNTHGYWVRSTGVAPISVNIPDRGFQDLPPAIPVVAGWNLVPVVSISGGAAPNFPQPAGTAIPVANAFAGAAWNTGYGFDPLTGNWTRFTGGNVEVGKAYWLYVTAKGTITP